MRAPNYLTVTETAQRLRVSTQTVYRWLRAGQLPATRYGRQWRVILPEAPLERVDRGVRSSPDEVCNFLVGREEHLLLLASDDEALERFMLACLEDALTADQVVPACVQWTESDEDSAAHYQDLLLTSGQGRSVEMLPFGERYARDGTEGVIRCLREAWQQIKPRSFWVAGGAPQRFFGVHYDRLIAMEATLDAALKGFGSLYLCGYALSLHQVGLLRHLATLVEHHTGLIWYDGTWAVLLRPQALRHPPDAHIAQRRRHKRSR